MSIREQWKNLHTLLSLDSGEKNRALLMFLYNFLLLNTLYLLKPVRDSLFLEQAGAQNLPFVFILTALAVIPVSIGYSRISQQYSVRWIINLITLFLAGNLFTVWFFIEMNSDVLYYAFYIWVSIYSVLITSQFWLFANTIYNAVQAKKVFGFLSLGAIMGAAVGGELTGILINVFDVASTSLLLVSGLILLSTIPLVNWIIQYRKGSDVSPETVRSDQIAKVVDTQPISNNPLKEILGNNHLLLITGLIGITVLVTTLIDFQFKTVAEQAFDNEGALTSFMGRFYGRVSLIAFLLQFFIGSYFTKKYGVSGAILILPAALLVSSFGMLLFPGLIAGTMSRGIDQSLKHSIDRTGRELLFIPLGTQLKKRIKVFIDLFVDHGAQGLTGLLLLGLTFGLNLDVQEISFVVVGLLFFWIAIAKMVSNSYIDQFRNAIKQEVESTKDSKSRGTEKSESKWLQLLKSHDESDIIAALKNLQDTKTQVPDDYVHEMLNHPSSEIKTQTIRFLRVQNSEGYLDDMLDFIFDSDPDLRMEAARYIYQFYEEDIISSLNVGLHHEDARIRALALGMIAEEGGDQEKALVNEDMLWEMLAYDGENSVELHQQMAKYLGMDFNTKRTDMLRTLMENNNASVVDQAISSAAETGERQFVHHLILFLGDPVHRKSAEKALKKFGLRIYGMLYDYMADPHLPVSMQKNIPWLFSQTIEKESSQILEMSLSKCSIPVRHGVIKAMLHLRKQDTSFSVSEKVVTRNVEIEISRYSKLVKSQKLLHQKELQITEQAIELIEEEIDQSFENIFRLLSLHYNLDDIIRSYRGITGSDLNLRIHAVEFIENLISWDIRKLVLPILENYGTDSVIENRFTSDINQAEDIIMLLY